MGIGYMFQSCLVQIERYVVKPTMYIYGIHIHTTSIHINMYMIRIKPCERQADSWH